MKISILVPCYNEEQSLEATLKSCLNQTRPFDELIFVNDCSTDKTPEILARYADCIVAKRTPKNTGNKSSAQEFGLQFVTGDVFVTTDGDTMLDSRFCEEIEKTLADPSVFAVAGYVRSLPYNWLTLGRAFEYVIGQNIHKLAQHYLRFVFVMPGASSAFRTETFRKHVKFDHDTITEDLDFTYKMHRSDLAIAYNPRAICYTQDPTTVKAYVNQMRRWFGGGWQNLLKHYSIASTSPVRAFELGLIYAEGLIFSILLVLIPLLNPLLGLYMIVGYVAVALCFGVWAAWRERRLVLVIAPFPYLFLMCINVYVYLEQFYKEIIRRRKNLVWFKPERVDSNLFTPPL